MHTPQVVCIVYKIVSVGSLFEYQTTKKYGPAKQGQAYTSEEQPGAAMKSQEAARSQPRPAQQPGSASSQDYARTEPERKDLGN
ncbi:hypothetical protein OS493_037897, partial [Desmophyllum pertusum]